MNDPTRARGTTFLGDIGRDVVYALRTFARAPLVALTIVSTVALGLGLVTVAFTLLNALVFRADNVPDVNRMFAVKRLHGAGGDGPGWTRAEVDALGRDTGIFTGVYAQVADVSTRVDGRPMYGTFLTGNAFQVLGVTTAMGRPLTPADDGPSGGNPVMVLSHRGWDRLFARDPSTLGRRVSVNGVTFEIVGVMPEGFRGLAVAADDYWAPLPLLDQVRKGRRDADATLDLTVIGRLRPGLSTLEATAQLVAWDAARPDAPTSERASPQITLVPRRGTVDLPREAVAVTSPLFFGFGLILLIGCANVANLLFARAVARQRELGIRLSLGAARGRLVRQLLTESVLLSLVAAAGGFVISRLVLEGMIRAMVTSMPPDIGDIRLSIPGADWRVLLFLIGGAIVSTIGFALAPALQATRIEPLRTIRGEVVRDARPARARDVLIGLQVGASALLLIAAAVFLRTAWSASGFDPGLRVADTVVVRIPNEPTRAAIVEAVATHPSVTALTASWPAAGEPRAAIAEAAGQRSAVGYLLVSPEYFRVLEVPIARGRSFSATEDQSGHAVAVVSETTARSLWPNGDAVGQILRLDADTMARPVQPGEPSLQSHTFTVIGVARDVPGFRIAPFPTAVVYVPANVGTPGAALVARVQGHPELARQALIDRLIAIDPDIPDVHTMGWVVRMETWFLALASWLTVALGGLALALTVSGLFSVLSYLVERRTKEIGVRMALGAGAGDVVRLILRQSIRPVGAGLLLGAGAAAGLAALLRATPAAAEIGQVVPVFDPLAYAASLGLILAACLAAASIPATRAARLDPTQTLRQE